MKTEKREGSRILVYGAQRHGVQGGAIKGQSYVMDIAGRDAPRFDDYDGLILFQGAFETFSWQSSGLGKYVKHDCDYDGLEQRSKESMNLLKDGGFICLLLTMPFNMREEGRDFSRTDLSKRLLAWHEIIPSNFQRCANDVASKADDIAKFVKLFGAAWSTLQRHPHLGDCKTLAAVSQTPVSLAVDGRFFVIPSLPPPKAEDSSEQYLRVLADGVIALKQRLTESLPAWTSSYQFPEEKQIIAEKTALETRIASIDSRLGEFERLKRVLVFQSEPLVDAVIEVLEKTLSIRAKRKEDFREDLEIANLNGELIAVAEVKGVSGGVAREHVNQSDSHRERSGRQPDFPLLLIINTHHRKSGSLEEKDREVASEQIQHAAKLNVLILRTIDLLNLAALHMSGSLSADDVVALLTQRGGGWLRVTDKPELRLQ